MGIPNKLKILDTNYGSKEIKNIELVRIIIDKKLGKNVTNIKRLGDRVIERKLALGKWVRNIISACAPQVEFVNKLNKEFWQNMDVLYK